MSRRIQLFLAVAILLVAFRTVAAQDTIVAPPLVRLGIPSNLSEYEAVCGFVGDGNMYGKGIRIGMYLQWITSSLAYNFVPEEALNIANSLISLSVGLIYITVNNKELYAVECWIVLLMCMGGVASERGFASYKSSDIGRLIKLILGLAIIGYWAWFVFSGMDKMIATPCSRTAFFFAKVVSNPNQ
ncbi:16797_t:CDS:2 [Acaulospora colombiana]|uniref:16797_t:CDS:1 n=1 Tax=Acaulospora colombiana TaxID=27376 RepID=A0ACA9NTB8_9GLOM|nr:16797_t:CDS:2 [Acaulospora colombiana]